MCRIHFKIIANTIKIGFANAIFPMAHSRNLDIKFLYLTISRKVFGISSDWPESKFAANLILWKRFRFYLAEEAN